MTNEQESILDKVQKLMAKAKGTENENEAAIFAAKAAELLAKHNLDEALLRDHQQGKEEGPIGEHPYEGRVPDRWRELILQGCAKLYFCKLLRHQVGGKKRYTLYGREHNAVVAKLMAEYLIATVKRMARQYSADKATQGDFRRGAGLRLYERLVALYNEQNKPAPASATGTTLPALYRGEENAIDQYIADRFPNLRSARKGKPMKHGAAAWAGRSAADSISLSTQVGGGKARAVLR